MKLVALYNRPANPENFEDQYFNTHMPLIEKVPGLQRTTITRVTRGVVGGDNLYMMTEMYFADKDSLKAGMRSPEMAAAGSNLDSFAKGLYTLVFAEER
ncbi:MAG: EthD family reductase [Chloroflexota bacterium]